MRLGIDTGGTFTDIVSIDADGRMELTKVPSSRPGDPAGILGGIRQALGTMDNVELFIHGTTMATNALVEKTGAKSAVIGTEGFRDLLEIRRAHRPREGMLDISWDPPPPLVRFTVRERINYYWSGGGGGYGDPLDREPERVLEDVKDGYVSVEGARRDYGVVVVAEGIVYDDWYVEEQPTEALRREMRKNPPPEPDYPLPVPENAAWLRK